jgi:N-acetylmuramoyl-L-alanine amidase
MFSRLSIAALALTVWAGAATANPAAEPDDGTHLARSSTSFDASYDAAVAKLAGSGLEETLKVPKLGAVSNDELKLLTQQIKKETPIPGVSKGDIKLSYDIILQPGHYGRLKGKTGASGKVVSERAINNYFVTQIAKHLTAEGLKVLVVPADGVARGLKAKIFLAIHADGSERGCTAGPSLGYDDQEDMFPMHAIGQGLAHAFGYDYADFRKDNYTVGLAEYYMFKRVNTTMLKGILEVGEVTCEKSEQQLIASSKEITFNVASALSYLAKLQSSK